MEVHMLDRREVSRFWRLLLLTAIVGSAWLVAAPAALAGPGHISTFAGDGIADYNNHRVRMVDGSGEVNTVAGNGTSGYMGDDGPATSAEISNPRGLAVDGDG